MITNEFPPPVLPIPEPKKSSKGIKIFAIACATIVGLALIGTVGNDNTKQAAASTPDTTVEKDLSYLDPNGLAKDALDAADEINATSTIEAPTTTVEERITDEDMEMVTWAVTALPALQQMVDISDSIGDASDMTEIIEACNGLASASDDLAANAPNNTAGDEARNIQREFNAAADDCNNFDPESALTHLEKGGASLTALGDEMDKWTDS